ncbi:PAS domain S-box protein [soil metagenome]
MTSELSTTASRQDPEADRLATLRSLRVVGAGPDDTIDAAARLAAELLACPIALVSVVDDTQQWFKAKVGLDVCSTPRDQSFCALALDLPAHEVLVVENAALDPRFAVNPLVTGSPDIRFYAGALLTASDGSNLGTLCVIDTVPRTRPAEAELNMLRSLARLVVAELERARSERLRLEQSNMLKMAEGLSGVGHWRMDLKTQRIDWSDEVYRIHGVRRATYDPNFGEAVDFYHPDDRETLAQAMAGAISGMGPFDFELRIRRADGVERLVASKGNCEFDAQGEALTMFGVFQDVTDQRAAMAGVELGRARYKLLADNVADVIARIQLDGGSNYISPAVEKLLGYTRAEMQGKLSTFFVHEDDRSLITDTFLAMASGQGDASVEHRVRHKDGHPIWVETRFRLVRDRAGAPMETVVVIRDISIRKALEDELRVARAAAEQAAAVKGEFMANMSHELRTPLTSIIGFTGLAAEQALPDLARNYIARVDNASRALLSTVNDILDFSKLEAGQVAIRPRPTDIAELCRQTLELFTPQAGAKDLALHFEVAADRRWVMVDPDRIRQILLNLVGNAVKFTASGSVTLSLNWDQNSERLHLVVKDTGEGVPTEKLDKLFKRFSQIDGSLTRNHGGTGLGLAICKGLAEAMAGRIGADSVVGTGSRFWFDIPAPRAEGGVAEGQGASLALPALSGKRILVADDHPANRELARLFLAGVGAQVVDADDGEAAVAASLEQRFDVILMDMRMPRLDGTQALGRIRGGGGVNAMTPILAYTADAGADEDKRLLALGFSGVVAKPVSSTALLEAVSIAALAPATRAIGRSA